MRTLIKINKSIISFLLCGILVNLIDPTHAMTHRACMLEVWIAQLTHYFSSHPLATILVLLLWLTVIKITSTI